MTAARRGRNRILAWIGGMLLLTTGAVSAADLALSDNLSGAPASTVTALLTINNVGGLSIESLDIELSYDPTVLTFLAGRNGPGLDGGAFAPTTPVTNDQGGRVLISGTTLLVGVIPAEGAVLFELDFEIRPYATVGVATFQDLVEVRINESLVFTSQGGAPNATAGLIGVSIDSPPPVIGMVVDKPVGGDLVISWDDTACGIAEDHRLVYGFGSQLPSTPGGVYVPSGSVCAIGTGLPYTWVASPDPSQDFSGLLWWLLVATEGTGVEGSAGLDGGGIQRSGPGPGGSSGECAPGVRNTSNSCP